MGRFSKGITVIEGSVSVFEDRPRLALLPALNLLLVGSALAVLTVLLFRYDLVGELFSNDLVRYAAIFGVYAVASGVATFSNAALVHCVDRQFRGEEASVEDGLRAAWAARRRIALWALTVATVGTGLYVIDEKFNAAGRVVGLVFDLAWGLLTFFVVPVLILEDVRSLRSILRQSGATFRETWGESLTVTFGIGTLLLVVSLPGAAMVGAAFLVHDGVAALAVGTLGGLYLVGVFIASQTVSMIARTALYEYATEGWTVGPFARLDPEAVLEET